MRGLRELGALVLLALSARLVGAWLLGEGAPFGPDGTGLEAAVVLGGHRYPAHVAAIGLVGSARTLSVVAGVACCALLWALARRWGLRTGGAWWAALLPVAVYAGAISAGDAPALAVVLLGALLARGAAPLAVLGGAVALASVAVKPIALPALVLLGRRGWAWLGFGLAWPWYHWWLEPLLRPRPGGGLLGTWWAGTGGVPPTDPGELLGAVELGLHGLIETPGWLGAVLLLVAPLGAWRAWRGRPQHRLRACPRPASPPIDPVAAVGPLVVALAVATALGGSLQPRYLGAAVIAALPFAGHVLPRWGAVVLLVPTLALFTQLGDERRSMDPTAQVPVVPVVRTPAVDARALFDESSTEDATKLRAEALRLAETLPHGATVKVTRRAHGREGELTWPLMVLRPDVEIVRETASP